MKTQLLALLSAAPTLFLAGCVGPTAIDETRLMDLSWPFNERTVYWPTAKPFELKRVAHGPSPGGFWYASNEYCASEHGGTHLDAPSHFAANGRATADIPITQLIGPARVIDIREQCAANRDYLLTPEDIEACERRYGRIDPGSAVLILTGFGAFYPDLKLYLGSDVRGNAEGLHFPGIGEAAARELVKRGVDLVGLDTASLDHGPSSHFIAHQVLSAANIPGLENVAHIDRLPPRGATLIALPMKIEGGTGGPVRIVAVLP